MQDNKSQLHPIEKSLLKMLANDQPMTAENLSKVTGLNIDQVRRGIEWLKYKNLVLIKDKSTVKILLGKNGLDAIKNQFPERRLVDSVKQGFNTMHKLWDRGVFKNSDERGVAFRYAVHVNKWLDQRSSSIDGEEAKLVILPASEELSPEEILLRKIHTASVISLDQVSNMSQEDLRALDSLKKRHFVIEQREKGSEIMLSDKGRQLLKQQLLGNEHSRPETDEKLA